MDRVALIILAVTDLAASVRFYRTAFGWQTAVDEPAYAEFDAGGVRLGLYQREGYVRNFDAPSLAPHPAEGITATEIYLHCADAEATLGRLSRAKARLLSQTSPRPWGDVCTYFSDPDGNVIVIASTAADIRAVKGSE